MAAKPEYATALRSVKAMWIDAGDKHEFHLDAGAAAFRRAVAAAGVPDDRVHFELFDGSHGAIEYRNPLAFSSLCRKLAA